VERVHSVDEDGLIHAADHNAFGRMSLVLPPRFVSGFAFTTCTKWRTELAASASARTAMVPTRLAARTNRRALNGRLLLLRLPRLRAGSRRPIAESAGPADRKEIKSKL
jgi:hypothetical protein